MIVTTAGIHQENLSSVFAAAGLEKRYVQNDGKTGKSKGIDGIVVPPSQKQSLAQQVVNRILKLIRTGNLRPGDRLPPERELIEIFRMSRPSLREALRALEILGVVEVRHGGGAYVTDLEARTLLAPLDFFLSLSQSNLDDAFESRRIVEVEIARNAARNATRGGIVELRAMIDAQATVHGDPIGFRILDSWFHSELAVVAGNAVLQRISYGLYNLGLDIRRRSTAAPGVIELSAAQHALIVDAIAAGDSDRAAATMTDHLAHIEAGARRVAALNIRETTRPESRSVRERSVEIEALIKARAGASAAGSSPALEGARHRGCTIRRMEPPAGSVGEDSLCVGGPAGRAFREGHRPHPTPHRRDLADAGRCRRLGGRGLPRHERADP